jgi:biotin carboxyl carrier protein
MKLRVVVDGEPVDLASVADVSLELVEPNVWSVLLAGRSFEVWLDDGQIRVAGRAFDVRVEDPRALSAETAGGAAGGRRQLLASMPGKVVRLLVAEGEEVVAGQGIVVVEAMKMQNEMPSPKAGRVTLIGIKEGDAVAAGQVLAAIE